MIECKNVRKVYKTKAISKGAFGIVRDLFVPSWQDVQSLMEISFSIEKGECVGILGTNGSGKSTLTKIMTGLFPPTSGEIKVLNFDPFKKQREFLLQIGVVFGHKSSLWWDLPLMDSFITQKVIYKIDEKDYRSNFEELVNTFNLKDILDRPVKYLSLGERVKSEIVANLLHDPAILFLDEPTVGLDILSKFELRTFIKNRIKTHSTTILLTTHDMVDVEECCQRVILLDKGKNIFDGTYEVLKNDIMKEKILELAPMDSIFKEDKIDSLLKIFYENFSTGKLTSRNPDKISLNVDKNMQIKDLVNSFVDLENVDITLRNPSLEEALRRHYVDNK